MARDATSSVKHLCDYESYCKLVKGVEVTVAQFSDVSIVFYGNVLT